MYCKDCGKEIQDDQQLCTDCEAKVETLAAAPAPENAPENTFENAPENAPAPENTLENATENAPAPENAPENEKTGSKKSQKIVIASIVSVVSLLLLIGLGFFVFSLTQSPVKGVNKDLYTATMEIITYCESDEFTDKFAAAIEDESTDLIIKEIDDKYAALEPLCESEEDKIYYEAFDTICLSLEGVTILQLLKAEFTELAETAGRSDDANFINAMKKADEVIAICNTHIETFKNATTVEEVKPLIGLPY